MPKIDNVDNKLFNCLICHKPIPNEEFEFEDYYAVRRGHNDGKDDIEAFICFDCFQDNLIMARQ